MPNAFCFRDESIETNIQIKNNKALVKRALLF